MKKQGPGIGRGSCQFWVCQSVLLQFMLVRLEGGLQRSPRVCIPTIWVEAGPILPEMKSCTQLEQLIESTQHGGGNLAFCMCSCFKSWHTEEPSLGSMCYPVGEAIVGLVVNTPTSNIWVVLAQPRLHNFTVCICQKLNEGVGVVSSTFLVGVCPLFGDNQN